MTGYARCFVQEPRPLARLFIVLAVLALSVHLVGRVRADGPPRIVVVDQGSIELTRKLRAEALQVGFEVSDARQDPSASDLALLARGRAAALVRVLSNEQVEVHIATPNAEEPYLQTLTLRPVERDSFALRIAEELRARLVELGVWAPEPVSEPAGALPNRQGDARPREPQREPTRATLTPVFEPAPRDRREVEPQEGHSRPSIWFDAGLAGTLPTGGLGPTPHGVLGMRLEPLPQWGIFGAALLPLQENQLAELEGQARVNVSLFGGGLDYSTERARRWFFAGGLGAGLLVLSMRGEAAQPFVGHDSRVLTGAYTLHVAVGQRLSDWLRIRTSLFGGASAPRAVLRFNQREVATWGRWFGGLAIRVEVGLPMTTGESQR